jgi:flagellar biosynthesis protein FlhG
MPNSVNRRFNLPPVWAVSSGKGGVGKSVIALGMAHMLSFAGRRVLLVDTDLGLGSQHILTNSVPEVTVENLLAGECALADVLVKVGKNLDLLPAASGLSESQIKYNPENNNLKLALSGLHQDYDLVIFDTAAGISSRTESFTSLADEFMVVVTPELASLADGYAVLKNAARNTSIQQFVLVVNMVQSGQEGENTAEKFSRMADTFLGLELKYSLWLPYDQSLRSILMRQSLLREDGQSCIFLKHMQNALMGIFEDSPASEKNKPEVKEDKINSDLMLSSQAHKSDKRNVKKYAGEPGNRVTNPSRIVSRNDSL